MKKLLVLCLSLLVTTWSALRAADDPGQIYADAFILEQDAQSAEANSDWVSAVAKYNAAAEKLRSISSSNPDWNSQVVQYRLKDVTTKLDAIKDKVPTTASPPPLPVEKPAVLTPSPAPAALAAEFATPEATTRLRAEVDRLKDENTKLVAELDEARKVPTPPKPDKQTEQLKQQNRQLNDQVSANEKEAADLKRQLTGETAEMKKLRTELTLTHSELETAQKSGQQVAELQRQNKELADRLTLAQKQAAAAVKAPSESADLKKLRTELAKAQADADQAKQALAKAEAASKERADIGKQMADLEKQNTALRSQLAATKSAPAPNPAAPVESAELKKLRADLANAQTQLDSTRKTDQQQMATLQQQNKNLTTQLATAKNVPAPKPAAPVESPELKKLRADLAATHTDLDNTRKANQQQLSSLQQKNKDLTAQLTAAQQKPAAPASESAELKKLRADLATARADADRAKTATARLTELEKQNKQLTTQLAAKPAPATPDAEVKKLRADLAEARASADRAKQASTQAAGLEKENKYLATQLAAAQKAAATGTAASRQNFTTAHPASTGEMAALEKQNAELKTLLVETKRQTANKAATDAKNTDLTQQNKNLAGQLSAEHQRVAELEKQVTAKTGTVPADSAELKNLRTQLAAAKASAAKSDELAKQNKELTGKLNADQQRIADLEKQVAAKAATVPADSPELKNLRSQLATAKASAAKADDLAKQNKELTGKLNADQQHIANLEKQVAAKAATAPADSPELKSLRSQLATAQAQAASTKAAAAKTDEVTHQNQDLSSKLAVAQQRVTILEKQVAASKAEPADTAQTKKLQADLADARAEVARNKQSSENAAALAQQNQILSSQLAASMAAIEAAKAATTQSEALEKENNLLAAQLEEAKKGPYIRAVTTEESAEIRQLKAELDDARSQANRAHPGNTQMADLEKQNAELAAQLEQAKNGSYIRPLTTQESTEIRQLRSQIDDMQTEVRHAQSANTHLDDLEKENSALKAQLEDVRKNAISKIEIVDRNPPGMQIAPAQLSAKDAAAMKKLRDENSYLRNLLDTYSSQVPELKPRLNKYQQDQPKTSDQSEPPAVN